MFSSMDPDVGNVDNILSYIIGQYGENREIVEDINKIRNKLY